jgi:hypothetical protein
LNTLSPFNYPKEKTPENWEIYNASVYRAIDAVSAAKIKWATIHPTQKTLKIST